MAIQHILLLCGVVAGPLFVLAFLVEGSLRPGYEALRQPVSALAQGERGWIQITNFIVTGGLMLACAAGLRLTLGTFWGPLLIGLYALGLVGAGVFVTDAGLRYGASTSRKQHIDGRLHNAFSFLALASLFAACFAFASMFAAAGSVGWQAYSMATGIAYGIGFMLFARGFMGTGKLPRLAGLFQRLTLVIGWIWVSAIATHFIGG